MQYQTITQFNGRSLVIGDRVLTMTDRGSTWADLTYIGEDEGKDVLLFAVHFTSYPVPLEFVDSPHKLQPGTWTWRPKPKA